MKGAQSTSTSTKSIKTRTRSKGGSSPGPSQARSKAKATAVITIDDSDDDDDGEHVAGGVVVGDEEDSDDAFEGGNEVDELDSDHLDSDESDEEEPAPKKGKRKAKAAGAGGKKSTSSKKSKKDKEYDPKGKNLREADQVELAESPEEDPETETILPTTLSFLYDLTLNNDRDWFQQHDPVYRHAHKNFNTFLTALISLVSRLDWTCPELPIKDVTHRIYRDIHFSQDKTPYRPYFDASLSRTGRKTDFCKYYIYLSPARGSGLNAGLWEAGGKTLENIRKSLLTDPKPFKKVLNEPDFVRYFGGERAVLHTSDKLKSKPNMKWKGKPIAKDHHLIEWLKLKSFSVGCKFEDDEVLSNDFLDLVEKRIKVLVPFVQIINEMIDGENIDEDADSEDDDDE